MGLTDPAAAVQRSLAVWRAGPDLLVIPGIGSPGERRLGWFLLGAGVLCGYGGCEAIVPGYSYRLGLVGPIPSFLLALLAWGLAVALAGGALFLVTGRSGTTLDRAARRIVVWQEWGFGRRRRREQSCDLARGRGIVVTTTTEPLRLSGATATFYHVGFEESPERTISLVSRVGDRAVARALAEALAEFLQCPVEERAAPPQT